MKRWVINICLIGMMISAYSASLPLSYESGVVDKISHSDLKERTGRSFISTIIPLPSQPLITKFKQQFTSEQGLRYLSSIMQRSAPYRHFIIEALEEAEVPAELLFLPIIESGFSETAVSRSGAVGMWQFMANSVKGYNMHINEWVDERRDPWKASLAAIKKLKWNYEKLGDWALALAAYNCGMGAMNNAIKKAGKADYWYLSKHGYLKTETVLYVPKFLAITDILQHSEEYGIDWGDPSEYEETAVIHVQKAVDIRVLAQKVGLSAQKLKTINPSLKHYITPPNINYPLRIPATYESEVRELLNNHDRKLIRYYLYTIQSGDTLYALANHYGISVQTLLSYNTDVDPKALKVGKNLLIPAVKQGIAPQKKQTKKVEPTSSGNFTGTYTVKKGDSLWSIALQFNTQVETLARYNNLTVNTILQLGKVLKVPIPNDR